MSRKRLSKNREIEDTLIENRNKQVNKKFDKEKQEMLGIVRKNGLHLQYAWEQYRDDRDVVKEAIIQNGNSLQYANPRFKNDKDLIKLAIKNKADAVKHINAQLQSDREFWIECIRINGKVIKHLPRTMAADRDMALEAIPKMAVCCFFLKPSRRTRRSCARQYSTTVWTWPKRLMSSKTTMTSC